MSIRNLEGLLAPKSVAMIGASTTEGSLGRIITRNLLRGGFKGPLRIVNPRATEIDGITCHPSVAALPETPDLAVIATPPHTVPQLIAELGQRGTRAAVVITAGITPPLRQAMLDAAKPNLLRIQGPNCLGLMLPRLGLDASFCHRLPAPGDLALVSQSGALITAIADWASGRGIGFSHIVSLGDMADVDFGDMLDYLAGDTQSRAILLYMEQLTHAAKFMSAARRAARSKPVIVIKAGRHAEGAKAAMSHTGALAGSDAAYDAAFRRAGLLRVNELEDLFNAAEVLSRMPPLTGERLLILTNGGGAGVLAADRLADLGGRMADLPAELVETLSTGLPPTWSHANPVDIIGDATETRYRFALETVLASDAADAILVMNCPTAMVSSTDIARTLAETRQKLAAAGTNPPLLACWLGDGAAADGRRLLESERIATFDTPASAIEGFMQLVRYRRAQDELMQTPPPLPATATPDHAKARAIITTALAEGRDMLSEHEAKHLLAAYAVPTAVTTIATTPAEVAAAARDILATHSACVLKILSHDISHKSDVGGVRLALDTPASAHEAAAEMAARIARERPDARLLGFTVQPMIRRPRAHELLLGMSVDPTFGPILMFGAGGTAVEVLRDTAQALPPLDLKLARDLMRRTRIHRLLEGYRDRPPAALDAIALSLVALSSLVIAHPEIREIDINPLIADETGVIALDARVRVQSLATPRTRLAIRPYPDQWVRTETLPGLGALDVRPIRPEDEALYGAFIERLTQEDLRVRFFTAQPDLSHRFIARMTQIDYAREMAFVAIDRASGHLLGVSRLAADPDYAQAEYAVIVASDLKGRGLGWLLMQRLIDYARSERIARLTGDVLADNTTMLRMCDELGFTISPAAGDPGLKRVVLDLTAAPRTGA